MKIKSKISECKQCSYKSCTQIGLIRHVMKSHNREINLKPSNNGKNKQSTDTILSNSSSFSRSSVPNISTNPIKASVQIVSTNTNHVINNKP